MTEPRLSRQQISDAVAPHGWRFVLGAIRTVVAVSSLAEAAELSVRLAAEVEPGAHVEGGDRGLRLDLRADAVIASLNTPAAGWVTPPDLALAARLTSAAADLGLHTDALAGRRSAQCVEVAIDAMDAEQIRPFWQAILGYVAEVDGIADPYGEGPTFWFQQMDAPRPQRNRLHIDISVPHEEAQRRMAAAIAAGGTVVYDAEAPAFWVLADSEGNEACICTWQGRDPQ